MISSIIHCYLSLWYLFNTFSSLKVRAMFRSVGKSEKSVEVSGLCRWFVRSSRERETKQLHVKARFARLCSSSSKRKVGCMWRLAGMIREKTRLNELKTASTAFSGSDSLPVNPAESFHSLTYVTFQQADRNYCQRVLLNNYEAMNSCCRIAFSGHRQNRLRSLIKEICRYSCNFVFWIKGN